MSDTRPAIQFDTPDDSALDAPSTHVRPSKADLQYDRLALQLLDEIINGELTIDDPEYYSYTSSLELTYWLVRNWTHDNFTNVYSTDDPSYLLKCDLARLLYLADGPDMFTLQLHNRLLPFARVAMLNTRK